MIREEMVKKMVKKKKARTVDQLFEQQVNKTPDSIAVVFKDEQVL